MLTHEPASQYSGPQVTVTATFGLAGALETAVLGAGPTRGRLQTRLQSLPCSMQVNGRVTRRNGELPRHLGDSAAVHLDGPKNAGVEEIEESPVVLQERD